MIRELLMTAALAALSVHCFGQEPPSPLPVEPPQAILSVSTLSSGVYLLDASQSVGTIEWKTSPADAFKLVGQGAQQAIVIPSATDEFVTVGIIAWSVDGRLHDWKFWSQALGAQPSPTPPAPPTPPIPPTPTPPPAPTASKLYLLLIDDANNRAALTADQLAMIRDLAFWQGLGHGFGSIDVKDATADPYKQLIQQAGGAPCLIVMSADADTVGKVLLAQQVPPDDAGVRAIVAQLTGKGSRRYTSKSGVPVYIDQQGIHRYLGRIPAPKGFHNVGRKTFAQWLAGQGLTLIPRSKWQPIDRRTVLGPQFVNNQQQCSGCVGFSGAQALMRTRVLRGLTFQKLSGGFLYAGINGGRDSGAMIGDAATWLQQHGTCLSATVDYPKIYSSQMSSAARTEAQRFQLIEAVTVTTFDELGTGIQMGLVPQFAIEVGNNFEQFDADGAAGVSSGYGNHSVHADGMKQSAQGAWLLDMPNSWGLSFGPVGNGRCYLREEAISGVYQEDAFIHVTPSLDPQDPGNPPKPLVNAGSWWVPTEALYSQAA